MPTLKQLLEALLFASDGPVSLAALAEALDGPSPAEISTALEDLGRDYDELERGVTLAAIAGGFQILSRKECAPWIERMLRLRRKVRLSRAGLEALAIVAYRQPITKVEIDSIRGVDSGGALHTLLERNLVLIKGRSKGVGRPLLYATTPEFLSYMGVNALSDLPELKELGTVLEARERSLDEDGPQPGPEREPLREEEGRDPARAEQAPESVPEGAT